VKASHLFDAGLGESPSNRVGHALRLARVANDGYGHAQVEIPDEFGKAPHVRGVLSLAHTGAFGETSSQFFIVQADSPHLDEHHNVLGRVVSGMEVVDAVTKAETDANGRWGPPARPLEDVVIERIWVEPPSAGDLARAQR